ncbi:hypothetical protein CRG98_021322 [Punica granatum]|uniref:Uncharacterized protein n=1 Tax=Punica granatum TaxID=22663 RepID=A0A2I0JQQ7_PUNGR|nr:hypothetical protein CRG98_021322 [Punica granatum]
MLTVGSYSQVADRSCEVDFLCRPCSNFCLLPRENRRAPRSQPIFTDSLYSSLIEEQAQVTICTDPNVDSHRGPRARDLKSRGLGVSTFPWGRVTETRERRSRHLSFYDP